MLDAERKVALALTYTNCLPGLSLLKYVYHNNDEGFRRMASICSRHPDVHMWISFESGQTLLEDTNLQSLVVVVSAPQVGFAAMNNRETVEFRPAPAATERGEDAKTGVDDTHLGTEAENRPYFGYSSVFCFWRLFYVGFEITDSYLLQMQIVCFI